MNKRTVSRGSIGRALGLNQFASIAGTGVGPLLYGIAKDFLGNFRGALQASSAPHLLLGLFFLWRALRVVCCKHVSDPKYARTVLEQEDGTTEQVLGRVANIIEKEATTEIQAVDRWEGELDALTEIDLESIEP